MGGIIWLASYPKSGNTWVRAFIQNFFVNSYEPVDINDLGRFFAWEADRKFYRPLLRQANLSEDDERAVASVREQAHVRISKISPESIFVKTHNYMGDSYGYPLHNMDVTVGAIYILRNPLDVAVSMANHYDITQDQAITQLGHPGAVASTEALVFEKHTSWSMHVSSWTKNPNPKLHVVRYEDLLKNPKKYFGGLVKFLKIKCPKERISRAINNSSFGVLKKQEQKSGFREKPDYVESFFRKGKKDQWREVLSEEQIKTIVSNHRLVMEKFSYIPEGY